MAWIVVDPKYTTVGGVKVARVEVPFFHDEPDYEGILGRAFDGEMFAAWREEVGVVILATGPAYETLQSLMGNDAVDVPAATIRDEAVKLALERQIIVLRWIREGSA